MAALLLTVAISVSHAVVCAGWVATPEARMACCADGGACAMHTGAAQSSDSKHNVSQAEADSCCAAAEGDRSSPSAAAFASTISLAVLGSATPAILTIPASSRSAGSASPPPPPSHVPKHVLLSVFLV